uniref:Chloramphenicol resistance protein n=1 Tax=uncultured organism TaxID=155900 RepID=A0A8A1V3J3_9ZZZZ|nr:chloramphenicol resistance protein [uncultured organism]
MPNLFRSPEKSVKNLFWFPLFLLLYSFTGNVSNDIYMPSMPILVHVFNTDDHWVQLTLAMWFLGAAAPQLLMGPIADCYGRRALLFWGGLIFLLSTLICAVSTHIGWLIVARFFQGVGVCSLTIVSFVVIHELFTGHHAVRLLALLNVCNSVAPLLGPLLGGYIFLLLGWRANFFIVFFLALIGLIGLWRCLPESKIPLDYQALAPKMLFSNYLALLKNRLFMTHLISYGLFFSGMIAYLSGAPFVIINLLKIPAQHFGLTQLAVFGAFMLTSLLVGKLVQRYGSHKIIWLGAIIIVLSSVVMVWCSIILPHSLYGFVGSMMGYAAGFGLAGSPLAKETLSANPQAGGFAAAMLGFSMTGFSSLASIIVSAVYNQTIISVAAIILIISLLALLIIFLIPRKR